MHKPISIVTWMLVLICLALVACSSQEPIIPTSKAPQSSHEGGAELTNTYWKLIELDGRKITITPTHEVHITLASEGSRLIAFSGCNQMAGAYVQDGSKLRFTQMMGTLMACESPFMELESQILTMLSATTSYRIDGEQLTLLGDNQVLARFKAIYLK